MASKALILRKLQAYKKNPDLIREVSNTELADLVLIVMRAVETIDESIKAGRLDGYTPKPDKDYLGKDTAVKYLTEEVNKIVKKTDAVLAETSTELEQRVQTALQNIRDGQDGIVTEAEIERAATIAATLIELPDFEAIMTEAIQGNGALIRDALESLPEGEEQLAQEAIQGLVPRLQELQNRIDTMAVRSGGTIGKNQVYNFIAQAVADGTIPAGGGSGTVESIVAGSGITVDDTDPANPIVSASGGAGLGDVVGPASSVDSRIAAFDGVTGKLIKDGGSTIANVLDRTNHTGTQTASTISDFDTAVAANSAVAANTAKVTNATHTGDVTGATALTIANDVVTNAKLANVATNTIKGRVTAATGDPEDLTATQVRTLLNVEDGAEANNISDANATDLTDGGETTLHTHAISGVTGLQTALDGKITAFADPNADRIVFWDDSVGAFAALTASTGLTLSGTNLTVRAASESQTGIAERATDAETVTGTDTTRYISPANLTARLAAPGTIGGTTPGAATFTTVTANTGININGVAVPTISSTSTITNKTLTSDTNKLRFQKSITIENPTGTEDISFFFSNNAITITEMRAVLTGSSTPSVTWTVRHGTDRSAAGAEVVTSGTTTTSTTTGSDVTSFNDATIVADSHVWIETSAQSGTVDSLTITVFYTED